MKKIFFVLLFLLPIFAIFSASPPENIDYAQINPEKYPDADSVLILLRQHIRYNPDATAETRYESVEKILTEKGRQENRTISMHFNEHYNRIEVIKLELERAGQIIPIDVESNSRVMTESGQMSSNIYDPNQRVLKISIPDLQPGDVIRSVYRDITLKSRIKGVWTEFSLLQFQVPALYAEIAVDAPPELPLKNLMIKDEIKGTIQYHKEQRDGRTWHIWSARNVPQFFSEPSMPPWYMSAQRLLLSTAADWEEISRWYWDLCAPRMAKITPAMKTKTAELIDGKSGDREKIEAIFQFVAKDIRYSGITVEKEAPGYEPHDVNLTFENRYGVCRDKAALLVALLREAGYNAFPVLFYSGPRKDVEVPNNYFNHAISAVELTKGEYLLMDSTNETTPEIFPSYLSNMSYLVARPEGDTLRTSAVVPATQNELKITTRGALDVSGKLNAETEIVFNGINDDVYRGAFSSWMPERVRQFVTQQLGQAVAGAVVESIELEPADLRDMSKKLKLKIRFSAKNFLIRNSERALFEPPWLGSHFGVVNFVLGSTGLKERKYPMQIFSTCASAENFELTAPAAWSAEILPEYRKIETPVLTWTQNLQFHEQKVSGQRRIAFTQPEITPSQYGNLKQALRDIEYEGRKTPIFRMLAAPAELCQDANAVYLDWKVHFEVKNPNEWVKTDQVRKQVLAFGGIKENSELKFHFNPAWGEVELLNAVVISPDGTRKEVSENEINIMDESWVGAAPRYPAGKMMVVSLPGVQIGSTIEYSVRTTVKNRIPFSMIAVFQDFDPILRKQVSVKYDRCLNFKVDEGLKTRRENGKLSWEVKNVPAIKPETALPPLWSFVPSVRMSAIVGEEYAETVRKALEDAVNKAATETVAPYSGSPEALRAKVREIRDETAKNIRNIGPGLTALPLSYIAAPEITARSGYGNSADRAVLLASKLKAAGLDYEFVLGSSLPAAELFGKFCNEIMIPDFFNEVLVKVKGFGLLNDTDQYAPPGASAHAGRLLMSLRDGSIAGAEGIARDSSDSESVIRLNDDGSAEITVKHIYTGLNAAAKKRFFSEVTPELLKRYEQTMVAGISENAELVNGLKFSLGAHEVEESITVRIARFAVKNGKYMQFNLPGNPASSLIRALPEQRTNAYLISSHAKLNYVYKIALPAKFKKVLMVPEPLTFQLETSGAVADSGMQLHMRAVEVSGNLNIALTATFNPILLSTLKYPALAALQARLNHPAANLVLIELK
ncbi:MAG: DUF3857 domain-containing protein [Lentisphaerae bacterium]|nr:DUF3857 domain-containing protein [Lentisphaerota bacterium]